MRELKVIYKDIRDTEKLAATKECDVPYKSRPGMMMAVRAACERLPVLLEELQKTVIPNRLAAVYASGDETVISRVAEFIKKNGGIVLDANEIYRKIGSSVELTYGSNRTFSTHQHQIMNQGIREIALNLDYRELPCPPYRETICPDMKSTISYIRSCIRGSIGDSFSKKFLVKSLNEAILKSEIDIPRIPILVVDVQSAEEKANLSPLFTTNTDFDFTPSFTISSKTLSQIFKGSQTGNNAITGKDNKEGA
jgi:hypothetical protein